MKTWKEFLFDEFGDKITQEVLHVIRKDRNGESVQRSLISEIVSSTGTTKYKKKRKKQIYLCF